jgi:hypothetical protein
MSAGTLVLLAAAIAVAWWIVAMVRKPGDRGSVPRQPVGQGERPYTTRDGVTAPKFGSAGSGGAEHEPAARLR